MLNKLRQYITLILLVTIAIMWLRSCNEFESRINDLHNSYSYKESMHLNNESTLKRTINEQGDELITQKQLLLTKKEALKMAIIENSKLKNVKSEVKINTVTEIKEVFIQTTDTLQGDSVKKIFRANNKWYGINGHVLSNGIMFDSVYFNNEIVTTIGFKKDGFFKRPYPVVEVVNKNPYSRIDEVYNVVIKERKKRFYETTGFKVGVGIIGGFYLKSKLK